MVAVVGGLCLAPAVQGLDERRVAADVGQERASVEVPELDVDLGCSGTQLSQVRHVIAVDGGRVVEITWSEPGRFRARLMFGGKCSTATLAIEAGAHL